MPSWNAVCRKFVIFCVRQFENSLTLSSLIYVPLIDGNFHSVYVSKSFAMFWNDLSSLSFVCQQMELKFKSLHLESPITFVIGKSKSFLNSCCTSFLKLPLGFLPCQTPSQVQLIDQNLWHLKRVMWLGAVVVTNTQCEI